MTKEEIIELCIYRGLAAHSTPRQIAIAIISSLEEYGFWVRRDG